MPFFFFVATHCFAHGTFIFWRCCTFVGVCIEFVAAITWIAEKLELQPINVLELVTFYPMFRRVPAGTRHIRVCRTLSCARGDAKRASAGLVSISATPRDLG